ncbi:MAG: endonuclease/exonuclease/phosphatase family protein [Candidatus Merdivicinus sp.]|jgi:endonuclease/exonuclease/phosphatase family metal-dependent hydrolase
MKLVTFNIRCDFGQDAENNFEYRKPLILKRIAAEKPDLIGFQEVLPHVQKWLRENLTGYTVVGCGRSADFQDEAMTIAVRNDTTELLGLETFWLSPDPYLPGSRYPGQSECPRICTSVIVNNQEMPGPIRVYNTHLDHIGAQARMQGLSQILRQMEDDSDRVTIPAVLMGDFNAVPDSVELSPIEQFESLSLSDLTAGIPITYHNYHRGEEAAAKIDYIFATPPFHANPAVCWEDHEDGVYLSDHYPVCVEIFA